MGAESHDVLVLESVKKIRLKDEELKKKFPFQPHRLTYWQADEARHLLYRGYLRLRTCFDCDILVTGNPKLCDKKVMVFDVDAGVTFQFYNRPELEELFVIYKELIFDGNQVNIGRFELPELKNIGQYCSRMDDCILEEADALKTGGIKDIFQKMWSEMGGRLIKKEDLIGQRINFLRDFIVRYKQDKALWHDESRRLRLMK